ncbi:MAG: DnaD domain protein, partial [Oscillospiraceae bacterium]
KELCVSADKVEFILDYWINRDEVSKIGDTYTVVSHTTKESPEAPNNLEKIRKTENNKPIKSEKTKKINNIIGRQRPPYTMAEIDGVAAAHKPIADLISQSESILGKQLTPSDVEMIYSFHDWLGLPVEVIIMLLTYAVKRQKTGKHYLETVAMDWADKGIDTYEAAEDYISQLESFDSYERQIRSLLGIYDRSLTQTEKKYITQWSREEQLPLELIQAAYDKTVDNTGKLSWAYMNKLLTSWLQEGIKSLDELKQNNDAYRQANPSKAKNTNFDEPAKKSKFNNYVDTNKTDYASLEEKILDMMLDN